MRLTNLHIFAALLAIALPRLATPAAAALFETATGGHGFGRTDIAPRSETEHASRTLQQLIPDSRARRDWVVIVASEKGAALTPSGAIHDAGLRTCAGKQATSSRGLRYGGHCGSA